jgi:hypothetical protein
VSLNPSSLGSGGRGIPTVRTVPVDIGIEPIHMSVDLSPIMPAGSSGSDSIGLRFTTAPCTSWMCIGLVIVFWGVKAVSVTTHLAWGTPRSDARPLAFRLKAVALEPWGQWSLDLTHGRSPYSGSSQGR